MVQRKMHSGGEWSTFILVVNSYCIPNGWIFEQNRECRDPLEFDFHLEFASKAFELSDWVKGYCNGMGYKLT